MAAAPSSAARVAPVRQPSKPPAAAPRQKATTPSRPLLRVVPPAPRRGLGWVLLSACGLLFVGMLAVAAFQARIAQNQLRLDHLDQELRDARAYYDRLRLAVAQLESPEYVVPRATNDLGMVEATSAQYLTPSASDVREVLVAAGGGDTGLSGGATARADWQEIKRLSDAQP